MYQPRPHGLHVMGGELTGNDTAAIELLARRLSNLRQMAGVDSLRMVRALPDGGYVVAQDMGGVFRIIAHKPENVAPITPVPEADAEGKDAIYIPMLFSGVIRNAVVKSEDEEDGVVLKLTQQTRRRLAGYKDLDLAAEEVSLQRFKIEYNELVSEFEPEEESIFTYTQYARQYPSWYSGAMAQVMQIVGGYGRRDFESLPDREVEQARFNLPDSLVQTLARHVNELSLPGYTGMPPENGQFQFDYKFSNTHAVSFDSTQQPWLLQIDTSGLWAMPLPMIPATATQEFRAYIESVGDEEILEILDRFAGMPSGESFLTSTSGFQAWRRAGVYIKLCELDEFYEHLSYSSACGWSFNSNGTEGFNTCYDYYDDEGLGYGLAFKLKITLSGIENNGKLLPATLAKDSNTAQYLSDLYDLMSDSNQEHAAIKYKLRRCDPEEIRVRATASGASQQELEYWSALELEPIATHSASLNEIGRGYLYHGVKAYNQPQIKFPDPAEQGCISHDFLPLINGRGKASYPASDTIMFGYYIDDQLKVVKYFRDDGTIAPFVQNDYEDCMTVGSWTQTRTTGNSAPVGNFYTSDIDERKVAALVTETTMIEGRDLGYSSPPGFYFDHYYSMVGTIGRSRFYSTKTTTQTTEGYGMAVAICIPFYNRNALIHAKIENTSGESGTESMKLNSVPDPNTYRYYTYDRIYAWVNGSTKGNAGNAPAPATPEPKDGSPVWVVGYNYNPDVCSDFADQGDWLGELPQDYTWLIHPDNNVWMNSGGGSRPALQEYQTAYKEQGKEWGNLYANIIQGTDLVNNNVPDIMYFYGSPSENDAIFYRDACKILFGTSTYANVSEVDDSGSRKHWGYSRLADHSGPNFFIGVINE
jgi:hypothetical protein